MLRLQMKAVEGFFQDYGDFQGTPDRRYRAFPLRTSWQ